MAPYGTPRYVDKVWKVIRQSSDGVVRARPRLLRVPPLDDADLQRSLRRALRRAARRPRRRSSRDAAATRRTSATGPGTSTRWQPRTSTTPTSPRASRRSPRRLVLRLARAACAGRGLAALCMAGGVALNSVANGRILRETPVRASSTSSRRPATAARRVGAALYAVARAARATAARFVMDHASWGQAHSDAAIARCGRRAAGCRASDVRTRTQLLDRVVGPAGARKRGRLVPGPLRVGAARARQPQHPRGPAPRRDEGHRQREDQVPRAVPAVRAVGVRSDARRRATSICRTPSPALPARFMLLVAPVRDERTRR